MFKKFALVAMIFAVAVTGLVAAETTASGAPATAGRHVPVLGKRGLGGEFGRGWGTPHPRSIYDGGTFDYNHVHWKHWGRAHSSGAGLTEAYRPDGKHYRKQVRLLFRASAIGHCPGQARSAYTQVITRRQKKPGGGYEAWSTPYNVCRYPA